MNKYEVRDEFGQLLASYYAESPLDIRPYWGENPQITITDASYEWALMECHKQRLAEYPAIGDQLDALYKMDHLGDSTQWEAVCAQIEAVKTRYPKPIT